MIFFDTFSQKFAQYKRENKKSLKGLKTEAQAKQFLKSKGQELKKDLEKAVRNKEKINFGGLPSAAKSFFGSDFVPKFKRQLIWENAELRRLTEGTFKFNESNQIYELLEKMITASGGGFFSDYITDGNEEERKQAIEQAINTPNKQKEKQKKTAPPTPGTGPTSPPTPGTGPTSKKGKTKDFYNIEDVFNYLNKLTNRENSNAFWEAWGLFADKKNFKLFINFPNS
jgi:hypothetical protein